MVTADGRKKGTALALALIAVLVFTKIMLRPFGGLDELWVYNLSRGIVLGYLPYKGYTMAMMPLFNWLFALPLFVVRNLFVYRVMSAVMMTALGFVYYRIVSDATDRLRGLFATVLFIAFMDFATYNGLMVMFLFLVFMLFGKMNMRNAGLAGVLCGMAVLSRQTSGVFLTLAVIVLLLCDKACRKLVIIFAAGWSSVMALFAAYLLATGSFAAFWDCCFFALLGSGEKNSGFLLDGIAVVIIALLGLAASVYLVCKKKERVDILHLVFGLVLLSVAIPTVDMMHMHYAAAWFMIPVLKLMDKNVSSFILKTVTALMGAVVLFMNVYQLPSLTLDNRYEEFRLIPLNPSELDYYEQLIAVNSRFEEEGRRVVVLSSGRCIISMMTDSFDPNYDLFLKANIGTAEPLSYIEEEMADPDVVFLIPDDYEEENWQNPTGVLSYIQDHCEAVERYDAFAWYVPR